jgi:hypothetical protein
MTFFLNQTRLSASYRDEYCRLISCQVVAMDWGVAEEWVAATEGAALVSGEAAA